MTGPSTFAQITGGMLAVVLTLALGWTSFEIASGALRDDYEIDVVLGELGQSLLPGNDVKVRGVLVGSVAGVRLTDDLQAVATLEIRPEYRIPADATFTVSGKTLLGEKQIEIAFDGPMDEGPHLAAGDLVDDPSRVTEFEDVLATFAELMEGIEAEDLAVVVDEFIGAFDGMGPEIARSIDEGARAAEIFSGSLDDQVAGNRNLADLSDELAVRGGDFNRLGRATEQGMPTITENQAELRTLLEELALFARITDETFTVTRPQLDRMMVEGDQVLRLLFDWRVAFGDIFPTGLVRYGAAFREGFRQNIERGQAAYFAVMIDQRSNLAELCENLPEELSASLPGCDVATITDPQLPGGGGLPGLPGASGEASGDDTSELDRLRDIIRPEVPARQSADTPMRNTVERLLGGGR